MEYFDQNSIINSDTNDQDIEGRTTNTSRLDSLIKEASEIINLPNPTRKDMIKLSRIEFNMAVCASTASRLALEEEERYNLRKSETTLEEKGRKKPITEAVEIGKYVAEKEHWCYRSMKEKAKWMWHTIESIRWFKISVYSSERENDELMNSNYKWL